MKICFRTGPTRARQLRILVAGNSGKLIGNERVRWTWQKQLLVVAAISCSPTEIWPPREAQYDAICNLQKKAPKKLAAESALTRSAVLISWMQVCSLAHIR